VVGWPDTRPSRPRNASNKEETPKLATITLQNFFTSTRSSRMNRHGHDRGGTSLQVITSDVVRSRRTGPPHSGATPTFMSTIRLREVRGRSARQFARFQPPRGAVLVGTTSIEKSEELATCSAAEDRAPGPQCHDHESEAEIVAQAGLGRVGHHRPTWRPWHRHHPGPGNPEFMAGPIERSNDEMGGRSTRRDWKFRPKTGCGRGTTMSP